MLLLLFLGVGLSLAKTNTGFFSFGAEDADADEAKQAVENGDVRNGKVAKVTLWNRRELSGGKLVWQNERTLLYVSPPAKPKEISLDNISKTEFYQKSKNANVIAKPTAIAKSANVTPTEKPTKKTPGG